MRRNLKDEWKTQDFRGWSVYEISMIYYRDTREVIKQTGKKIIWKKSKVKLKKSFKHNLGMTKSSRRTSELHLLEKTQSNKVRQREQREYKSQNIKLFERQCKKLKDKESNCCKIKAVIWHKVRNDKNERNTWTGETKPLWYSVIINSCVEACDKPLKSNVKSIFCFLCYLKCPDVTGRIIS